MKVLFIYRSVNGRNSVVDAQADSLICAGIDVYRAPIVEGGIHGYFQAIRSIRGVYTDVKPDIVHSHYVFSFYTSLMALPRAKQIASFMGSDINDASVIHRTFIRIVSLLFLKTVIVKSAPMQKYFCNAVVIPNGVDFDAFVPTDRNQAKKTVGFSEDKFNVIFVCENPESKNKNLYLAKTAIGNSMIEEAVLHVITGKNQSELINYYNAADLLLMTSTKEGSPNVIKEALVCNCPVVSTVVGDVSNLLEGVTNSYCVNHDIKKISEAIMKVYKSKARSNGREMINRLDCRVIASLIINEYNRVLQC